MMKSRSRPNLAAMMSTGKSINASSQKSDNTQGMMSPSPRRTNIKSCKNPDDNKDGL